MTRSRLLASVLFALALGSAIVAATQPAQPGHYGIFSGSTSIGGGFPGNVIFDPHSAVFRLTAGGADMWGASDSFHLAWVKLQGDATIAADIEFPDNTPQPLAKAVLIFRQTLDPDSAYADVAIHADGHITLQWRDKAGAVTADATSPIGHARRIQIVRHGDVFTASFQSEDNKMIPFASHTVPMTGPVYMGIGACPHDLKGIITIRFTKVALTRPGM